MSFVVSWVIIIGVTLAGAAAFGVFGGIIGLVLGFLISGFVGDFLDLMPDKKNHSSGDAETNMDSLRVAHMRAESRKIIADTATSMFHLAANLQSRANAGESFPKEEVMALASRLQDHAADLQLAASEIET